MRAILLWAMVATLGASWVEAQQPPTLEPGARVWVTTLDGREHEGSLASQSSSELVLRSGAASRTIALADVRRIEGSDSLANGIRNGAIAGAAALGGFGMFLSLALCEIPDGCLKNDLGPIFALAGIGAGAGMAAGALIDRAISGRRLLWTPSGRALDIRLVPYLTVGVVGADLCVSWPP